jgi:hypothetical protein
MATARGRTSAGQAFSDELLFRLTITQNLRPAATE